MDEYLEDEALEQLEMEEINDQMLAELFEDDYMDFPSIADYDGFIAL